MDNKLFLKGVVTVLDKAKGTFNVIASTGDVDRDGEIINPKGWELDNFRKNPVILWAHNYSALPIGKATKIEVNEKGLVMEGVFASKEANPLAQQVRKLHDEGIQSAVSVGFMPLERNAANESVIERAELLELSFVPVPANPNALALALAKGIDKKVFDMRGAIPEHTPPMALIDKSWDADEAILRLKEWAGGLEKDKINFDKFATGFAWFDNDNPKEFNSYKFLHHDIIDGEFKVNFHGVVASMGTLLGSRGDVDIPETDKKLVYDHLAKHYEQFGKEAPEFRTYEEAELKTLFPETKDIAETIALANLVDHLAFLTDAFRNNEVSLAVTDKMEEALKILLGVLKTEATIGRKEFIYTKSEHSEVCDPNNPKYNPQRCAELEREREAGKQQPPDGTVVQSLIMDKKTFETRAEAITWAREHDFKANKVDETEDSWRLRQLEPSVCDEASFRTIDLTKGVQAVICRPQKSVSNTEQAICLLTSNEAKGENPDDKASERSQAHDNVMYELPTEVIHAMRRHTLKSYHSNELMLSLLKKALASRNYGRQR